MIHQLSTCIPAPDSYDPPLDTCFLSTESYDTHLDAHFLPTESDGSQCLHTSGHRKYNESVAADTNESDSVTCVFWTLQYCVCVLVDMGCARL